MVQEALKKYISQREQQGYSRASIEQALLNAGYPPKDISEAFGEGRKIGTKMLLIIFLILLGAALAIIFVLKITQQPPAEITQRTELFSTEAEPGGKLILTTILENPGGRQVSGLIDYIIQGPEGTLLSETDEFSMQERKSIPKEITIPDDALQGAYTLRTTIKYNDKTSEGTVNFKIAEETLKQKPAELEEKEEIQEIIEEQASCPTNCDDYDFCTVDDCVDGKCVSEPIVPCCGNNKCEDGESERNCALDCAERPPNPEQIKQEATEKAATSLSAAISTCQTLNQQAYIDSCLLEVSETTKSKETCELIAGDEIRDACYIPFAYDNDFSVCNKISNSITRNTCHTLNEINEIKKQIPQD